MTVQRSGAPWWKTWVLVISAGATLLGWGASGSGTAPANTPRVSSAPLRERGLGSAAQTPVFHTPVTRTRRS